MAASNLYPPLLAATLPAFVYSEGIYSIPFNVSQYNSPSEISKWIQISVVNPYTGQSALSNKYPNGIVTIPADDLSDGNTLTGRKHTVKLDGGDLLEDPTKQSLSSLTGQYLKIQLRFCSSSIAVPSPVSQAWLAQNIDEFSEWSKATLVRIISRPTFLIQNSKLKINEENYSSYKYTDSLLKMNGTMVMVKEDEDYNEIIDDQIKENLLTYRYQLYQYNQLIEDSGTKTAVSNKISYTFKKKLIDSVAYSLKFTYKTLSGYTNSFWYYLIADIDKGEKTHIAGVSLEENAARGGVELNILLKYPTPAPAQDGKETEEEKIFNNVKRLQIKRSDNFSNYEYWETVHYIQIPLSIEEITYSWIDATVDCGRWYQYEIREIFEIDEETLQPLKFGKPYETDKILIDFEDIYLNTITSSLKIKFNPEISGYKNVTQESITNTIGSQFPFVRKNGKVNYHQFSIKGLISCAMDEEETFLSKQEKYGLYNSYYNAWREANDIYYFYDLYPGIACSLKNITSNTRNPIWTTITESNRPELISNLVEWKNIGDQDLATIDDSAAETTIDFYKMVKTDNSEISTMWSNDYIWERYFRQAVEEYLYDGKPKLYRSATEGNILVYLNNVSLTPNKTLGRTIYEFTAQCTEIAEASIDNLKKYGILENDLQRVNYRYVLDTERYDPEGVSVLITKESKISRQDSVVGNVALRPCELGTINEIENYYSVMAHNEGFLESPIANIINKDSHKIFVSDKLLTADNNQAVYVPTYDILVSREVLGLSRVAGDK